MMAYRYMIIILLLLIIILFFIMITTQYPLTNNIKYQHNKYVIFYRTNILVLRLKDCHTLLKISSRHQKLLSSAISINSSSLPQQQICYHECTKCGIIYKCTRNSYEMCHLCQKRHFYFNPWFY
jgi:hypothetical protein